MRISDWSSDVCSSDLRDMLRQQRGVDTQVDIRRHMGRGMVADQQHPVRARRPQIPPRLAHRSAPVIRSEEHTSELQSLMRISYAVFCLKKQKQLDKTHVIRTRSTPRHQIVVQRTTITSYHHT